MKSGLLRWGGSRGELKTSASRGDQFARREPAHRSMMLLREHLEPTIDLVCGESGIVRKSFPTADLAIFGPEQIMPALRPLLLPCHQRLHGALPLAEHVHDARSLRTSTCRYGDAGSGRSDPARRGACHQRRHDRSTRSHRASYWLQHSRSRQQCSLSCRACARSCRDDAIAATYCWGWAQPSDCAVLVPPRNGRYAKLQLRSRLRHVNCTRPRRWCDPDLRRPGAALYLRPHIMSAARDVVPLNALAAARFSPVWQPRPGGL